MIQRIIMRAQSAVFHQICVPLSMAFNVLWGTQFGGRIFEFDLFKLCYHGWIYKFRNNDVYDNNHRVYIDIMPLEIL